MLTPFELLVHLYPWVGEESKEGHTVSQAPIWHWQSLNGHFTEMEKEELLWGAYFLNFVHTRRLGSTGPAER